AVVVPGRGGQVRGGGNDDGFSGSEGALAEESLVGEDLRSFGVIDCDEAKLIDVVDLFHGLAEAQAVESVAGLEVRAVYFDPFVGIVFVGCGGGNPMADDGGSDYVGDE